MKGEDREELEAYAGRVGQPVTLGLATSDKVACGLDLERPLECFNLE